MNISQSNNNLNPINYEIVDNSPRIAIKDMTMAEHINRINYENALLSLKDNNDS